jgi:hypothetical protein
MREQVTRARGILRTEWIAPPKRPDKGMLRSLLDAFRARPRIAEAWLIGEQGFSFGEPAWVASHLGLVLDPPYELVHERTALLGELIEATGWGRMPTAGWGHATIETWRVLTPAEAGGHTGSVRIYSRGTTID